MCLWAQHPQLRRVFFDLVTEKEIGVSQGSISKSRCEQITVAFTSLQSFACLIVPLLAAGLGLLLIYQSW